MRSEFHCATERCQVVRDAPFSEDRVSTHEEGGSGPCGIDRGRGGDPAVDRDIGGRTDLREPMTSCLDLRKHRGDELLPGESGVDAHDQDLIDLIDEAIDARERRIGSRRDPHTDAQVVNGVDDLQGIRLRLDMEYERVPARPLERLEETERLLDHQVDIERKSGTLSNGVHERRPERDVRHEVAIHDIEVEGVRSSRFGDLDRISERGKVRAQ